MEKMMVNKEKCPQNHKCPAVEICPQEAISQVNSTALPEIDAEKCILCGACVDFCPKAAFETRQV